MRRIAFATALVAAAGCGSEAPETASGQQAVGRGTVELVERWGFMVTHDGSGSGSNYTIDSEGEKEDVLDALEARVATVCGTSDDCHVELTLAICAPSLGTDICTIANVAGLVGWETLIDRWSDAQQAQIEFLEDHNVPAVWVRDILTWQRERQALLLERALEVVEAVYDERDRIVDDTRTRLGEMGEQVRGEEVVRLANTRWAIRDLERITARYQAALDAVRPAYADVAARYTAYRATETAVITALGDLATTASTTELAALPALKQQLAVISGDENRVPQQLVMDALRVRWTLAHAQAEYEQGIARHAALIDEHGWTRLDHTSAPRTGMDGIVGYADGRMERVNVAVRDLLDGLRRREQALVLVAADQATRDAVIAATTAHTEAAFLDEVTARTTALWVNPPTEPRFGLPVLGERVRLMQAYLQLAGLCGAAAGTWRQAGCVRIGQELTKVRRYLTQTLPFTIKFGVRKMRLAGVPETELAPIEAELTAGKTTAATHRYDAALRAAEGS